MFSTRLQSNRTYAQAVALLVVFAVKLSAVSSIVSILESENEKRFVYKSIYIAFIYVFIDFVIEM